MIECYCAATPNSRKVLMTLEECELAYTRKTINLAKGEQQSAKHIALNPAGAVPVIVDYDGPKGEKITLTQSFTICLYLSQKAQKLLPKDPVALAHAMQWSAFGASDLAACTTALYLLSHPENSQAQALEIMTRRLVRHLDFLNNQLDGKEYVVDEFSLADILIYPSLLVPPVIETLNPRGTFQHIEAWLTRIRERPAIARGL